MQSLDILKSGKHSNTVAFRTRYGQYERQYLKPTKPRTKAQCRWRELLGAVSAAWARLTEQQRIAWIAAGALVRRRTSLGKSYSLTGQAHFVAINSARARIGRELLLDPPQPEHFGPSPVGPLTFDGAGGRLSLQLSVCEPFIGDIMVIGAAPCSPGRMKCRNVTYLGLLSAPVRGFCGITRLYREVFGLPPAGARVFIRTQQQINGWESRVTDTSAIAPARPAPASKRRSR
ncbi:MAG: hypothetical protein NT154_04625 [Verrucomicrobia bacterium]|nr:hypothetical protein [Verrucomicrobiota bacterium]